jgi:integrase/recombinase XerD
MKDFRGYLKPEEIEKMLDNTKNPRDYLIMRLLWRTGMRVSELVNMEVNWIDFDERMLNILGKGNKWRRVPIDRDSVMLFQNYLKNKNIKAGRCFDITRQRVFQIIKTIAKNVGIEKPIHPHTLRHSYAVKYDKIMVA